MTERDYTFQLSPGTKTRYNAGPYDQETCSPRYSLELSVPEHARRQVDVQQYLMGNEGSRIWVWDINNKSTWPVFIIIKKDGVLVRDR